MSQDIPNPTNSRNLMHPENAEALLHFMEEAFPESQRLSLTPEQMDEFILSCRIWALQEPEAFEAGVALVIRHFASEGSSNLVEALSGRYSLLEIAWMTKEAFRRYL
jgi:hypothetical protein